MSLDPHVSDTFEILSVFFTNIFYNELYLSSLSQTQQSSASSITDLYKKKLIMYYGQMNSDVNKWFNNFIVRIKLEYDKHTKHIFITNAECIDNMCTAFVPTDFIKSIVPNKKFSIVFNCIRSVVSNMISEIGQQHLTLIIDERKDKDSIVTIKESFMNQFMAEREKMFGKFIDSHTRETRTTVSAETVKRIRDESEITKKENGALLSKIRSMMLEDTTSKREIERLTNTINILSSKNEKLCSYVKEFRSKLAHTDDVEQELIMIHRELKEKIEENNLLKHQLFLTREELANKPQVVPTPISYMSTNNKSNEYVEKSTAKFERNKVEKDLRSHNNKFLNERVGGGNELVVNKQFNEVSAISKDQLKEIKDFKEELDTDSNGYSDNKGFGEDKHYDEHDEEHDEEFGELLQPKRKTLESPTQQIPKFSNMANNSQPSKINRSFTEAFDDSEPENEESGSESDREFDFNTNTRNKKNKENRRESFDYSDEE